MIVIENIAEGGAPVSMEIEGVGVHGLLFEDSEAKSGWMAILGGCAEPEKGHIFLEKKGERLPVTAQRARIGYVPTALSLYEDMTVLELLDFFAAAKGATPDKRARQIKEALELMGMSALSNRLVSSLSAQNYRRLAFAQAVLGSPAFLVCDEPLAGGSAEQKRDVEALLEMLGRYRPIVIGSTSAEILPLCADVTVIGKKGLLYSGRASDLLAELKKTEVPVHEPTSTKVSLAAYFGFSADGKEEGVCS